MQRKRQPLSRDAGALRERAGQLRAVGELAEAAPIFPSRMLNAMAQSEAIDRPVVFARPGRQSAGSK